MRKIASDAFEQYVALGQERSYQGIANKYDCSKNAVAKIAAKERWSERLAKIEQEARDNSDKKLVEKLGDMRLRHLKTCRVMHAKALQALQQHPLTSAFEAFKVATETIKLERLIAGEVSERTAVDIEEVTRRELSRWLLAPEDEDDAVEAAAAE